MAAATVRVVDCSEAPIDRVTVFSDRAEIKRKVAVELKPGSNEVGIKVGTGIEGNFRKAVKGSNPARVEIFAASTQ